jgi:methyl-accepting chemotaxis protein
MDWLVGADGGTHGGLVGALAATSLIAVTAVILLLHTRKRNLHLTTAVDNMSQGLCMLGADGRLIIFNHRYLEMYGLSAEVVRPGCRLRDLIDWRIAAGTFSGNAEQYVATTLREIASGKPVNKTIAMSDGRFIALHNRPMAGGGWVCTHEDITEQRRIEQQHASMAEQERRRLEIEAAIQSFRQRVATVLKTVNDSAGAMRSTATNLSEISQAASHSAEGAAQASSEASASVSAAAIAAEELLSSIVEISRQLGQTTDVVQVAVAETQNTNEEIAGLAQVAGKIGNVVKLIRDIAGQTNLLALNATIEAARAGEAGRGFAVVASEVKLLAVQTSKATEEIAGQIAAVQNSSAEAVEAIRRIGERMREINQYTTAVAASLLQQNSATDEISHNVASAAQGATMFTAVLREVAGAATETHASAQTVLTASEAVQTAAAELREEVEQFLSKVAA